MKFLKYLFALGLFLCPAILPAQTLLIGPWDHGSWLLSAAGGSTLYGASDSAATFLTSQWSNPQDLSDYQAFTCPPGKTTCFAATSPNLTDTLFTDSGGNQWVDIAANGAGLPCYPGSGGTTGYELGNFLSAIGPVYPSYPQAILASANLGSATNLILSVTVEPLVMQVLSGSQCTSASTKDTLMVTVVLSNPTARQTLYYQLRVRKYNAPVSAFWFSNRTPFGFNDDMVSYGLQQVPMGAVTTLSLDTLPRLAAIITAATNGIDSNLSHWNTAGAYMGNDMFGHLQAENAWCCFSLVAQ